MIDIRYSKDLEEDRLFWEVVPHYNDAQETIVTAIADTIGKTDQGRIVALEIGCGTGLTTQKILAADSRITLTAIDNVEYIVEQAKIRFAKEWSDRLTIVYADAFEYVQKQPPASFDAVITALVLHNCPSNYRKLVFGEIYRVLKKGGVFINVDKMAQDDVIEHNDALAWQLKEFEKFDALGRPDLTEKWIQHYYDDEKEGIVLYESAYKNALQEAGFSDLRKIYRYQMEAGYVGKK